MALLCAELDDHRLAYTMIDCSLRLLSDSSCDVLMSMQETSAEMATIYACVLAFRYTIVQDWSPEQLKTHEDFSGLSDAEMMDDSMDYLMEALSFCKKEDGFFRDGCHIIVLEVLQLMGSTLASNGLSVDAFHLFKEAVSLKEQFSQVPGQGKRKRHVWFGLVWFNEHYDSIYKN